MPSDTPPRPQFDDAVAHLLEVSDRGNRSYIEEHRARCIDDAVRLAARFPGGKVLNVGGRPYLFEAVARQLDLEITTVDLAPDRDSAAIAALGIEVLQADFENKASRSVLDLRNYDVICMAEIFEHMRMDLVGTFRWLSQAIRPEAIIYLTTPNFYFAPRLFKSLAGNRSGPSLVDEWSKLGTIGHMGHVREYARSELVEFFRYTGFAVECFARNSQPVNLTAGGLAELPARWLARMLAKNFDRFAQELVFTLRPMNRQGAGHHPHL